MISKKIQFDVKAGEVANSKVREIMSWVSMPEQNISSKINLESYGTPSNFILNLESQNKNIYTIIMN